MVPSDSPPDGAITLARGDHFTFEFWSSRKWQGDFLALVTGPDNAPLPALSFELIRFETTHKDAAALERVTPKQIQSAGYRVLQTTLVRTDSAGRLILQGLEGGKYSLQPKWSALNDTLGRIGISLDIVTSISALGASIVPETTEPR
jgi:hypothetical protein